MYEADLLCTIYISF